jgi:HlyD family secretion protein
MKKWMWAPVVLALVAVVGLFGFWRRGDNGQTYKTAKVARGDIVQSVKATGTVTPLEEVDVGTQVSGKVASLLADFNSVVTAGQVVARIDPAPYQARVEQDEALLAQAQAELEQANAQLELGVKEHQRDRELAARSLISASDLDTSSANLKKLRAQLKLSRASVEQAAATLRVSRTNLDYTVIRSPVNGVVINRNVNQGQTVVASFAAQTLFVIATDLSKMEVEASIPEADIGQVRVGQSVEFTVDAYPDEQFIGQVSEVRLAATTVSNVVTYPVIIVADNPDRKLMPGMTATVSIEVQRKNGILTVPNSALRFKPPVANSGSSGPPGSSAEEAREELPKGPRVYVQTPEGLKPISITTGVSDGVATEVTAGLQEGQEVVTRVLLAEDKQKTQVNNPFTPKFPSRTQRRALR